MGLEDYTSVLLRFGLGSVFLYFGIYEKLYKPDITMQIIENLNINIPIPLGLFIFLFGILELVIGSFLVLGLYTRITSIVASLMILGIILQFGYLNVPRDPALLAMALSLIITGSKKLSIDRMLDKRKTFI
ncbi:MAG: DoxX family protein [Candidatus Nanoarchaeia archaeon]|nr:DoxX family protein [Candidatus Nanoarchaeia archaeon]